MSANRVQRSPTTLAYAAYCAARIGQSEFAVAMGREAIDAGASSAAVHNNLGYSLIKYGQPKLALAPLDVALRRSPNFQAAWYNRALARHQLAVKVGGVGFDPAAVADMDEALLRGPVSAQLFYDAAGVYAAASAADPALRAKAIRCLAEAVKLGKDPSGFERGPLFRGLTTDPEFQQVLKTPPGPVQPIINLRLVEPDTP